jgi:hypothetical protein
LSDALEFDAFLNHGQPSVLLLFFRVPKTLSSLQYRSMQDRVQTPAPDSGYDLYIFSAGEKPGWRSRQPGSRTQAPHPGSAISYQDRMYEVVAMDGAPNTPYSYRYMLRFWEDCFPIRQVFPYSLEAAREVTRKAEVQHREAARHRWAVWWFALTGLLPTPVATRWQHEWGLPMRQASMVSIFVMAAAAGLVGPTRQDPAFIKAVMFVAFEQLVRFFWWLGSKDAVGSLSLTSLWLLWTMLTGRDSDGGEKRVTATDFESQRDEVKHLTVGEDAARKPWDLEVSSMLRDPVLLGPSPVRYFGEVYEPLEYLQEGEGIRRRYIFRLKKLDPSTPAGREYQPQRTPEHVAQLVPYERARDLVHRMSFFCGLLPSKQQMALADNYDYDAGLWSGRTAKALAVSAAVQLWAVYGERIGPAHLVAAYLLLESLYRLVAVHVRGVIVGSALGWLLAPFLPKK